MNARSVFYKNKPKEKKVAVAKEETDKGQADSV